MAWEEVTLSQCLPLLLEQVKLEERELWVSGLDALTVTLLAAASPQHDSICHPPLPILAARGRA